MKSRRLTLVGFFYVLLLALVCAAFARPAKAGQAASPPPGPPPEMIKAAQEAAAKGIPSELVQLPVSTESANATGPSSHGSGDGLNQMVKGTAPAVGLTAGGNAVGGDTNATNKASAFAPFDPSGSNISGWIFIALGIGLIVGRAWIPIIPVSAGAISIAVGIVLLILPSFLNQHPFVAVVLVGAAALIALLVVGGKARWFDTQVGPAVQKKLIGKGQHVAAGALAHLAANAPFAGVRSVRDASETIVEAKKVLAGRAKTAQPQGVNP